MSVDLREALAAYEKVAHKCGLPAMRHTRCAIDSRFVETEEEVASIVRAHRASARAGWLGFQSGNVLLSREPEDEATLGVLMDAELAEEGTSLHVRSRGDGWIVTTYASGSGEEFLADEVTMLTKTGTLHYERLWGLDGDGALQQLHARLVAPEVRR